MSDIGADPAFEARLREVFAQPPRLDDAVAFAARVDARLGRDWALRRLAIGAAGGLGGVVAASQAFSVDALRAVQALIGSLGGGGAANVGHLSWASPSELTLAAQAGWLAAGALALGATALAARRWAEGL